MEEKNHSLIFLGESHEDPAALNVAFDLIQKGYNTIFLEQPSYYENAKQVRGGTATLINILNKFPNGVPKKLESFTSDQRMFVESLKEQKIYGEKLEEIISKISVEYDTNKNRRPWLEVRYRLLDEIANNSSHHLYCIDVEEPLKSQQQERTNYMFTKIKKGLNSGDKGLVIVGMSHLLNTREGGVEQTGLCTMVKKDMDFSAVECHFALVFSKKDSIVNEAIVYLNQYNQDNLSSIKEIEMTESNRKNVFDLLTTNQVVNKSQTPPASQTIPRDSPIKAAPRKEKSIPENPESTKKNFGGFNKGFLG